VKDADEFYRFLTGPEVAGHEGLEVVESLVVITPVLRGSLIVDEAPAALSDDMPTGAIRL
jgi:hypothetical protein